MGKIVKFVAFDVDGTLRDRDYLPNSAREALAKLQERGIVLALCTGRSEYEMASLREELRIDWAITCNGSHIGYRGETVFGTSFSEQTVRNWVEEAERLQHSLLLYGSRLMLSNRPDDVYFRQAQQEIGFMEPVLLQRDEGISEIYQCILFCNEQEEYQYIGTERDQYYIHRWRPWAFDLNPSGMNKAVGLLKLLGHLGISPVDAAAFGDGLNDMEMIESVGFGIAMGNAGETLKSKARYVTGTLHEDGVAYAVEKWVLNG